MEWLDSWTIEDLSDESPQQANDFDCGIFTLLNICLLVEEGSFAKDSTHKHPSTIHKDKGSEKCIHVWNASSNRPEV